MELPDLQGKTALVTGAGRGIGRATALALSRYGARVVVVARGQAQIDTVAREIVALGAEAHAIGADVSDENAVRRLFAEAGPIDIVINNAGIIQPIGQLARADPHSWVQNIEVNLHGPFYSCRYALPGMLERGWGRIINVTSGAAKGKTYGWSAYAAAKAGVEALTGVVALEVGDRGVHINAVRPGIVDTDMHVEIRSSTAEQFSAENVERFRAYKERNLLRPPEHVAQLILWLLSPEAESINGQVFAIDDPEVLVRVGLKAIPR